MPQNFYQGAWVKFLCKKTESIVNFRNFNSSIILMRTINFLTLVLLYNIKKYLLEVFMENTIETLVEIYESQTISANNSATHEDHHQNGPTHVNNPGTDWHQTHTNSYFK